MIKKYLTKNYFQTKKLGRALAKEILKTASKKEKTLVIALEGDLGSGKTTFIQGFTKGLGIKEKTLSPTFVILKRFKIPDLRFEDFYHIDCYRIKSPEELLNLGFKEIIAIPKNIVAIEWSEKIKKILPKNVLKIKFKFIDKNLRAIHIK